MRHVPRPTSTRFRGVGRPNPGTTRAKPSSDGVRGRRAATSSPTVTNPSNAGEAEVLSRGSRAAQSHRPSRFLPRDGATRTRCRVGSPRSPSSPTPPVASTYVPAARGRFPPETEPWTHDENPGVRDDRSRGALGWDAVLANHRLADPAVPIGFPDTNAEARGWRLGGSGSLTVSSSSRRGGCAYHAQ